MKRLPAKSQLRDWIIQYRLDHELTHEEMASLMRISRTDYTKLENGRREVMVLELFRLDLNVGDLRILTGVARLKDQESKAKRKDRPA